MSLLMAAMALVAASFSIETEGDAQLLMAVAALLFGMTAMVVRVGEIHDERKAGQ